MSKRHVVFQDIYSRWTRLDAIHRWQPWAAGEDLGELVFLHGLMPLIIVWSLEDPDFFGLPARNVLPLGFLLGGLWTFNAALVEQRLQRHLGPLSLYPPATRWLSRALLGTPLLGLLVSPLVVWRLRRSESPSQSLRLGLSHPARSLVPSRPVLLLQRLDQSRFWAVWLFAVNSAVLLSLTGLLRQILAPWMVHGLVLFFHFWAAVGIACAVKLTGPRNPLLYTASLLAFLPLPWAVVGLGFVVWPQVRAQHRRGATARAFEHRARSRSLESWKRLEREAAGKGSILSRWWQLWGREPIGISRTMERRERFAQVKTVLLLGDGGLIGLAAAMADPSLARSLGEDLTTRISFLAIPAFLWMVEPLVGVVRDAGFPTFRRLLVAWLHLAAGFVLGLSLAQESPSRFWLICGLLTFFASIPVAGRLLLESLTPGVDRETEHSLHWIGLIFILVVCTVFAMLLWRTSFEAAVLAAWVHGLFCATPLFHLLWALHQRPWLPGAPWLLWVSWLPLGALALPFWERREAQV